MLEFTLSLPIINVETTKSITFFKCSLCLLFLDTTIHLIIRQDVINIFLAKMRRVPGVTSLPGLWCLSKKSLKLPGLFGKGQPLTKSTLYIYCFLGEKTTVLTLLYHRCLFKCYNIVLFLPLLSHYRKTRRNRVWCYFAFTRFRRNAYHVSSRKSQEADNHKQFLAKYQMY